MKKIFALIVIMSLLVSGCAGYHIEVVRSDPEQQARAYTAASCAKMAGELYAEYRIDERGTCWIAEANHWIAPRLPPAPPDTYVEPTDLIPDPNHYSNTMDPGMSADAAKQRCEQYTRPFRVSTYQYQWPDLCVWDELNAGQWKSIPVHAIGDGQ